MSHHLDTPLAKEKGQLYIDDLYVFQGEDSTVLVMDVNSSITGADIQPGFHPDGRYEFRVHFDGADDEGLAYRVTFGVMDAGGRQTLQLHESVGSEAGLDSADGRLILAGRTGETTESGDVRIWAGRSRDPFYIDLSLLGIVSPALRDGTRPALTEWRPDAARNTFADQTVDSIVLEVSHAHPLLKPGAHIGVWCATILATDAGGWRQINRAGHPMMWPIFRPDDTRFADPADSRHPQADFAAEGEAIASRIAAVVEASGSSDDPGGYGVTVARTLFPDVLPYVVGTPAAYGFASLNGRTLADNVAEVMLSLVLNEAIPSGLRPSVSEAQRTKGFPYLVAAPVPQLVG